MPEVDEADLELIQSPTTAAVSPPPVSRVPTTAPAFPVTPVAPVVPPPTANYQRVSNSPQTTAPTANYARAANLPTEIPNDLELVSFPHPAAAAAPSSRQV